MKKLFSVILLTILLTSIFAQSFPAMAAPECKKYEITVPEGTAFNHYPVYKDGEGNDYKMKYKWSKDALDDANLLALGDHTYVISVKEETWVSVEEYTFHVVSAEKLPECTRDESKIDFGLHKLPIDLFKAGIIGGCAVVVIAAAIVIVVIVTRKKAEPIEEEAQPADEETSQ